MRRKMIRRFLFVGAVIVALVVAVTVSFRKFSSTSNFEPVAQNEPGLKFLRTYGGGINHPRGPMHFSEDGGLLHVTTFNQGIQIWELATSRSVEIIPHPPGAGHNIGSDPSVPILSADRSVEAHSKHYTDTVTVRDGRTKIASATLKTSHGYVDALALSPDGTTLAVACVGETQQSGEIEIWDVPARRITDVLGGHTSQVFSAVFTPDGKTIVSSGNDARTLIWDVESGRRKTGWLGGDRKLSVSADGLSVSKWGVWCDIANGRPRTEIKVATGKREFANEYAAFPDGIRFAEAGPGNAVTIRDSTNARISKTFKGHSSQVRHVALNADATKILSFAGGWYSPPDRIDRMGVIQQQGEAYLWDIASGEGRKILSRESAINTAALSPDGKTIAVSAENGKIEIYDSANAHLTATWESPEGVRNVTAIAFSPNGHLIAASGGRASVKNPHSEGTGVIWLIDAATGQRVAEAQTDVGAGVECLSWRGDGKQLIAGTMKRSIYLWQVQ